MAYVEGTDLHSLCKHYGALPSEHVVSYIVQAAAGLSHAHSRHVFHRNVKPSNLLLDRQGVVKVIGLGLARIDIDIDDGSALTKPGQMMGTYDYMAPEQAVDSRTADHRADIYSLGCTMFKLLTGRAVYPEKSVLRKVRAHSEAPVPSMRQVKSEIPLFLDLLCQKMLAKRPEDRFLGCRLLIVHPWFVLAPNIYASAITKTNQLQSTQSADALNQQALSRKFFIIASSIKPNRGSGRGAWLRRSNGRRVSCFPASGSSRPT